MMPKTLHLRSLLVMGASAAALSAIATPALAQTVIEELVVTAQRREQALQDVPVAVSAFSEESLRVQRIDGGQSLLLAVPNVNFSRSNFGGYNFAIRGIGTKVVGSSGEAGVSFHVNNSPLTANRLADAEFYDVERVEVLRGPQGTLYGRNATGGVVNILTQRPTDELGGWITAEYGNYNTQRVKGAINVPLGDMFALRWAGFYLSRDGYGDNIFTGNDIDDRDITSSRISLRFEPNDVLDANLMWEHFNEKDSRSRIGKQLCIKDPGPTSVGGVPVSAANRNLLSQGCLPGSRYQDAAYGTVNTVATLGGLLAELAGLSQGDLLAGKVQNQNLLDIESVRDPIYQGQQDFIQLDVAIQLNDVLTFNSLTSVNYNEGYSYQDYNRVVPDRDFNPVGGAALLFPGGFVNDPQVGRDNTLRSFDLGRTDSKEFTQELRLSSSTGGAIDFSLGGLYSKYQSTTDYYVFSNGLTAYAQLIDAFQGVPNLFPFYVDPNFPPNDGEGHNYYDARAHTRVQSTALFGELYWQMTEDLRATIGLRHTMDKKRSGYLPITLLAGPTRVAPPPQSGVIPNPVFNGGRGFPPPTILTRSDNATTGRLNLEWSPDIGFTESSLFYASYSRGYKGGGFNTPCDVQSPGCGLVASTFAPEFVNAFEIGTKNVLMGGSLVLNATGFFYDYKGYQISKIINKSSQNENIDAQIMGLEFESIWEPIRNLRFNLNAGWLETEIKSGTSIDTLNRTQGDPNLTLVKASDASNCVVSTAGMAALLAAQQGIINVPGVTGNPTVLLGACSGQLGAFGLYNYAGSNVQTAEVFVNGAPGPNFAVDVGQGVAVDLVGNQLPNAPEWTLGFGAQYRWFFGEVWDLTLRGDYYRQADSYARIFNSESDRLEGYQNINATVTVTNTAWDMDVQLYVKNITDEQPITDIYLTDDSSGLFTNVFTVEPRQYGVAVTKRF